MEFVILISFLLHTSLRHVIMIIKAVFSQGLGKEDAAVRDGQDPEQLQQTKVVQKGVMNMIGTSTMVSCSRNPKIVVQRIPGHFALTYSHTNAYVDIVETKRSMNMASAAAEILAESYAYSLQIDTIVTMDGMEVLGAFLAESLVKGNRFAVAQGEDIHVVTPELENSTQMIFRDNLQHMIRGKKALILCGSLITGSKVKKAMECVKWYGGDVVGIAAVFSILGEVEGIPVQTIFNSDDVPGFESWDGSECPFCKAGEKIDALANCYGYSRL